MVGVMAQIDVNILLRSKIQAKKAVLVKERSVGLVVLSRKTRALPPLLTGPRMLGTTALWVRAMGLF